MQLLFTKSKWEMWDDPLPTFLRRARKDGFEAVEIFLPALSESPAEVAQQVADHGLQLVAQINTVGDTPAAHRESLIQRFEAAVETAPLFVNSHTARDIFSFEDNVAIFAEGCRLTRAHSLMLTHETHRRRPLFCAPETVRYLKALPDMVINADFSHWFCVHESDLSDQPEALALAVSRSHHIHARVGFAEGPQVSDPLAPCWHADTARSVALWQRIVEARAAQGAHFLTITPEFGPPPYMPIEPRTGAPLADAWATNLAFRDHLKAALKVPS